MSYLVNRVVGCGSRAAEHFIDPNLLSLCVYLAALLHRKRSQHAVVEHGQPRNQMTRRSRANPREEIGLVSAGWFQSHGASRPVLG